MMVLNRLIIVMFFQLDTDLIPKTKLSDVLCSIGETLEASRCLPVNEAI
jgi:hypothetical protein